MKKFLSSLILTIAVAGLATSARAASIGNLADLQANNGSLTVGDKTFSNFDYTTSGLVGFDASQIIVEATLVGDVYYLTWSGNISAGGGGPFTADLKLNYTVTASAGHIDWIDQSYTGSAQGVSSFLAVDESVYSGPQIVANSHLDANDLSDPFAEQGDDLSVPGLTTVDVTKDIAFGVFGQDGGFVTISEVRQSFHQVPDAGLTIAFLGSALVGLGLLRRKLS